jgi:Tol biopolymer transport system component
VGIRVADGVEQPITSQQWDTATGTTRIAWLSDNSGVLATGAERGESQPQIWHLSWPGDEAHSVTNDLNGYADVTLTADSKTLAAVRSDRVINLWVAPNGEAGRARQITSGAERGDGTSGLDWTPDGKIVYRSVVAGNRSIWITTADGAESKQLSANAIQHIFPTVSPDGRYIVWSSLQGQRPLNIWRMGLDGSNPKQITNGTGEESPNVSPDGKWVVYMNTGNSFLWKVSIDGGAPAQLTDKPAGRPVFSPDGKLIACNYQDEASGQFKIAVIPSEGGLPTKVFDVLGGLRRPLKWTPDGRAIAFIRTTNGVSNIWAQSLDGGQPRQLTNFKDQRIFNFSWSRDGKQLALSRGVVNSDVVLISGFK